MKYTLRETIECFNNNEKNNFMFFWGHTSKSEIINKTCFSQWFPSEFKEDGRIYKTAEHYMMATKAQLFNDQEIFEKIIKSKTPKDVKTLGRQIKNFDDEVWNTHKYNIVKQANYLKFSQNDKLKEFLLSTAPKVIVEASPVDTIWGVGLAESDVEIHNPNLWKGENLLGYALMEVRDILD